MVGTGTRLFFALAAIALLGAGAYGVATGGDPLGVASVGYKGGVGEHFGYAVLTLVGVSSLFVGIFSAAVRDLDPTAAAPADAVAEVPAPASSSPWPLVAAFGGMVLVLGLVVGASLFVLGVIVLVVATIEWAVKVWSDRATGDPAVNLAIRNRLMAPIEIPIGAALVIVFLVLGISRALLAVSPITAVVIGSVAATLIVAGALLVLGRSRQSSRVATLLLVLGGLAVIAGGIAGVAAGEREFHEHEPAHEAGE
jgi:hypothetical protein